MDNRRIQDDITKVTRARATGALARLAQLPVLDNTHPRVIKATLAVRFDAFDFTDAHMDNFFHRIYPKTNPAYLI